MKTVLCIIVACCTFSLFTTAAMATDEITVGSIIENVVVITDSRVKTFSISTDKSLLLYILDNYPDGIYFPYSTGESQTENLTKKMEIFCSIQNGKVTKLRPGKCF